MITKIFLASLLTLIFSLIALAQTKESLFKKEYSQPIANSGSASRPPDFSTPRDLRVTPSLSATKKSKPLSLKEKAMSNLPDYYASSTKDTYTENPIITPTQTSNPLNTKIQIGEIKEVLLPESLIAFPDTKTPIRALITTKDLKGSILLGEASLDKTSKRILITFQKLNEPNKQNQISQIQAHIMSPDGTLGLEGKIISHENKYFTAELLSALASGFMDATIERNQNAIGNYQDKPGLDTASKKALITAMGKSAEFYADKLKQNSEYAILSGPIPAKILITDQATIISR